MCGIFGYLSNNNQGELLQKMGDAIPHRGPDGEGFYSHHNFHMGIKRLSIIDLETGDQPISNEDQSIWIVFNGAIYNYKELTKELSKKGHFFKTQSDTEVIVHAYEEYGDDFLERLNGMFAFALYDKKKKKFFIARDRFGEKPLYYYKDETIFLFASEIKSLLQYEGIDPKLDNDELYKYLILRYVPTPKTLFKNIYKLPAANYIEISSEGFSIKKYWDIKYQPILYKNESDYFEHFNSLFEKSVRLRMVSDVPMAAYLSSGVDSTSIVNIMSGRSENKVMTYSIGCKSPQDEVKDAQASAHLMGCSQNSLYYDENSFDHLEKIIWHLEEPIGDAHIIPTYLLAQSAANKYKVVLHGEGADESLFGYPFHKLIYLESTFRKVLPDFLLNNIAPYVFKSIPINVLDKFFPLPTSLGKEGKKKLGQYFNHWGSFNITNKFIHLTSLFNSIEASQLLTLKTNNKMLFSNQKEISNDAGSFMKSIFSIQLQGWLQDNILLRHDKLAMAHSIESRAPFLDHHLVDFIVNIPINLKFRNTYNKYILRNQLINTLDKNIAHRKKIPFFSPIERFSETSKFNNLMEEYLGDSVLKEDSIFNKNIVSSLKRKCKSNDFISVKKIMSLIIFQIWKKKFRLN